MPKQRRLVGHVVSHTHWDRAWYWTFEQTRVRLLDLIDDLLALLAREPAYAHFVLDGQLALVEDYLALRPERRAELAAQVQAGRLLLGPFFVLPDLFLPSGESLVRNLRLGARAAAGLGPLMKLGYLPDPFGHPAQLPQLLRGFGIAGLLLARGLGDEGEALGADFLWQAPDGSQLQVTHQLAGGYCNLAALGRASVPDSSEIADQPLAASDDAGAASSPAIAPEQLRRAAATVRRLCAELAPKCASNQLLLNNGCDHLPPQPELPQLLAALNAELHEIRLVHSTPLAYQQAVRRARRGKPLPQHQGELRGGRYANLLPGVLSARVDLKLLLARAERTLLWHAEPWLALSRGLGLGRDDRALTEQAWRLLLLCQPHDDICGCSIDPVHQDDLNRLERALQIAEAVGARALDALARRVQPPSSSAPLSGLLINPYPWPRQAVLEVPGVAALAGAAGPLPCQPHADGCLVQATLPGCGYLALQPATRAAPPAQDPVQLRQARGQLILQNSKLTLQQAGDTVRLRHQPSGLELPQILGLLDEGDAGDTYDFSPPAVQRLVQTLDSPRIRILERGPLRAALHLESALHLPRALCTQRQRRSARCRKLPLRATLRLAAGSPLVELDLELENTVDDHRLRWAVDLPFAPAQLFAGAPFQVIARPTRPAPRPRWQQPPAPTQPFSDFVALEQGGAGLALFAPGLHEVEVQRHGRGSRVLITLLRSVRWLSRDDLQTRQGLAGPMLPVEGARQLGRLRLRLALLPYSGNWLEAEVPRRCQEHAWPPRYWPAPAGARHAPLPPQQGFLQLAPGPTLPSALAPVDGGALELRLVNLSGEPTPLALAGVRQLQPLDLDGRPRRRPPGQLTVGPYQILSLRLSLDRDAGGA